MFESILSTVGATLVAPLSTPGWGGFALGASLVVVACCFSQAMHSSGSGMALFGIVTKWCILTNSTKFAKMKAL